MWPFETETDGLETQTAPIDSKCCYKMEFIFLHDRENLGAATTSHLSATLLELCKGANRFRNSCHVYHFREVMTHRVTMTEAIGGQQWVTILSVRPLIYKLSSLFNATISQRDEEGHVRKVE